MVLSLVWIYVADNTVSDSTFANSTVTLSRGIVTPFLFIKARHLPRNASFDQSNNKRLQWWFFYVPLVRNGRQLSYSTSHKTRTSANGVMVLVLTVVSSFCENRCRLFLSQIYFASMKMQKWKVKNLVNWLQQMWKVMSASQWKVHEQSKYRFCKFFNSLNLFVDSWTLRIQILCQISGVLTWITFSSLFQRVYI